MNLQIPFVSLILFFLPSLGLCKVKWLNLSNHGGMNWGKAVEICNLNKCNLPGRNDFKILKNSYSIDGAYSPPAHLYSYTFWSSEKNHMGRPCNVYDTALTFYGYTGDFFQVRLSGAQYGDEANPTVRTMCICHDYNI